MVVVNAVHSDDTLGHVKAAYVTTVEKGIKPAQMHPLNQHQSGAGSNVLAARLDTLFCSILRVMAVLLRAVLIGGFYTKLFLIIKFY